MSRFITNSEVNDFKRCRRKWRLRHVERLVPIRDPDTVSASKLGTLVHLGLEAHYSGQDAVLAVSNTVAAQRLALVEAEDYRLPKYDKQANLALTMVSGYLEWLEETGADSDLEVIAPERRVEVPVTVDGQELTLLGKLDLQVRRISDGARLFMDHKTVQSLDQFSWLGYVSPQFRHYHILEKLNNEERSAGAIINMLRKVGRSAKAKPPFYGRQLVQHNDLALGSYWTQLMGEIRRIVATERELQAGGDHDVLTPPNPDKACAWDCEFRAVCPMFGDGSDVTGVLQSHYTTRNPLERYEADEDEDGTDD